MKYKVVPVIFMSLYRPEKERCSVVTRMEEHDSELRLIYEVVVRQFSKLGWRRKIRSRISVFENDRPRANLFAFLKSRNFTRLYFHVEIYIYRQGTILFSCRWNDESAHNDNFIFTNVEHGVFNVRDCSSGMIRNARKETLKLMKRKRGKEFFFLLFFFF